MREFTYEHSDNAYDDIEKIENIATNAGGCLKLLEPFKWNKDYSVDGEEPRVITVKAVAIVAEVDSSRLIVIDEDFENWDVDDYFLDTDIHLLFETAMKERVERFVQWYNDGCQIGNTWEELSYLIEEEYGIDALAVLNKESFWSIKNSLNRRYGTLLRTQ